jgi:anti-anti-sigma factor
LVFHRTPDITALHGGRYDISRANELARELEAIEPHSDVVLDLKQTAYLDCSCIGVLIANLKNWQTQSPQTRLRLINVAPNVASVLTLLRLDELFIVETATTSF